MEGEQDSLYGEFMASSPFWCEMWSAKGKSDPVALFEQEAGGFSDSERDILLNHISVRQKDFCRFSIDQKSSLLCGLVDILFSICYDYRLCCGDFTSESCTNIARLSATFSGFESYDSDSFPNTPPLPQSIKFQSKEVEQLLVVILFSFRRLCCCSYLRHWKMGRKVLADVTKLFLLGKRPILKLLLQTFHLFQHTDSHYLFNILYLKDYCVWLQQNPDIDEELAQFGRNLNQAKTWFEENETASKRAVGLYLDEMEDWVLHHEAGEELPDHWRHHSALIEQSESFAYLRPLSLLEKKEEDEEKDQLFYMKQERSSLPPLLVEVKSSSKKKSDEEEEE